MSILRGVRFLLTQWNACKLNLTLRLMFDDQKQESMHYNAYETDIALVNIFFGDPTAYGDYANFYHYFIYKINIKEFERLPKMTWLDFISGFGGLCGLCLGISFVSVAEILYWFSIRLCRRF